MLEPQRQQQGQEPQQQYQPPKTYTGLKAGLWIAVAMLIHFVALLLAQLFVMVIFMVQDIASGVITVTMTGDILYDGTSMLTSEAYLNRYVYESSSYGTALALPLVVLGIWVCSLIQKTKLTKMVACRKFPVVPNLLGFVVGFSVCVPISYIVSYTFLKDLSPDTNAMMDQIFVNTPFWLLVLATAVCAPIMEELTFRGFIYTKLQTAVEPYMGPRGYIFTIIMQGLLFGAFHMNLQQFIYASVLGFLFGWMRHYTQSIWPGIFAHIGFNFFSVGLYGLLQYQEEWGFAKWVAETSDLTLMLIALPIFAVSMFSFEFLVKRKGKNAGKTSQNQ